jgi:hypothetical protein
LISLPSTRSPVSSNSSAHLNINPAAGRAVMSLDGLTAAAHERGVKVRILEPGESAHLAAFAALEAGADAQQEVKDVGGGKLIASVKDAGGNVLGLIQLA